MGQIHAMNEMGLRVGPDASDDCKRQMESLRRRFGKDLEKSTNSVTLVLQDWLVNTLLPSSIWGNLGQIFGAMSTLIGRGLTSQALTDASEEVTQQCGRVVARRFVDSLPIVLGLLLNYLPAFTSIPQVPEFVTLGTTYWVMKWVLNTLGCTDFAAHLSETWQLWSLRRERFRKTNQPIILWSGVKRIVEKIRATFDGLLLHPGTVLGTFLEAQDVGTLNMCDHEQTHTFWSTISRLFAQKIAVDQPETVYIAVNKSLEGSRSLYNSFLWEAELPALGESIREMNAPSIHDIWNYTTDKKQNIVFLDFNNKCSEVAAWLRHMDVEEDMYEYECRICEAQPPTDFRCIGTEQTHQ